MTRRASTPAILWLALTSWSCKAAVTVEDGLLRFSGRPVREVAMGNSHVCFVSEQDVYCFGRGDSGQLGDGVARPEFDSKWERNPVRVVKLPTSVRALVARDDRTCAQHESGVVCWGKLANGRTEGSLFTELTFEQSVAPRTIEHLDGITQLSLGDSFACALRADATVACWGYGGNGVLGGLRNLFEPIPVPVDGIRNASEIASSAYHTCALIDGGRVACWGVAWEPPNMDGTIPDVELTHPVELERDGGALPRAVLHRADEQALLDALTEPLGPRLVLDVVDAVDIEAGGGQTCAILRDRRVSCWKGRDTPIQSNNNGYPPTIVAGVTNVEALALGNRFGCALSSGSVRCWGEIPGVLETGLDAPQTMGALEGARAITAGNHLVCAIGREGDLRCLGWMPGA